MPESGDGLGGGEVAAGGAVIVLVGAAAVGASQTDHTGPLLAFVGALLVSLIAAVTAGRRQKRSLDAERTRLTDQLAHDRKLHDLEHLRVLLDEAMEAYELAYRASVGFAVAMHNGKSLRRRAR